MLTDIENSDLYRLFVDLYRFIETLVQDSGLGEVPVRIDVLPDDLERGILIFPSFFQSQAPTQHKIVFYVVLRNLSEQPIHHFLYAEKLSQRIETEPLVLPISLLDTDHGPDDKGRLTTLLVYETQQPFTP